MSISRLAPLVLFLLLVAGCAPSGGYKPTTSSPPETHPPPTTSKPPSQPVSK